MKERFAAGWKPKSKQQQLVTRLRMSEIGWRRRQHRAAQRSIFEAAKAEAYMQLAMQYTSIVDVYRVPTMTLVEDPNSGLVRPVMARAEYHVVDPFAAALAAHWGEKAARSKAFAVAQDYRAKTYYRERIETVQNRIEALQGYALARQIRNPAGRLP